MWGYEVDAKRETFAIRVKWDGDGWCTGDILDAGEGGKLYRTTRYIRIWQVHIKVSDLRYGMREHGRHEQVVFAEE